jgi:hypothetical protein
MLRIFSNMHATSSTKLLLHRFDAVGWHEGVSLSFCALFVIFRCIAVGVGGNAPFRYVGWVRRIYSV